MSAISFPSDCAQRSTHSPEWLQGNGGTFLCCRGVRHGAQNHIICAWERAKNKRAEGRFQRTIRLRRWAFSHRELLRPGDHERCSWPPSLIKNANKWRATRDDSYSPYKAHTVHVARSRIGRPKW